ncbi:hypothetical protein D3C83_169190 [compost metagenome]
MREHEAGGGDAGEIELVHDRHEIVAVRAEAVHPDDGGGGVLAGFYFDCFEKFLH